jgi:cell division protein FtsB
MEGPAMSTDSLSNLSAERLSAMVRGVESDLADARARNAELERQNADMEQQIENLENAFASYKERARRWRLQSRRAKRF